MANPVTPVVEGDLHAYVDGQLSASRHSLVSTYLQANPEAATRVKIWRKQKDGLLAAFGKILHEPLPVSLSLNVSAAARYHAAPAHQPLRLPKATPVTADIARPAQPIRAKAVSNHGTVGFLLGLSCAFTLAGLALVAVEKWSPRLAAKSAPPSLLQLSQRAMEGHTTFAADRVHAWEIPASKTGQLPRYIGERAGIALNPPDLQSEGLTLGGARLLPGDNGPAALLIYESAGGERVSLMVARHATENATALPVQEGGLLKTFASPARNVDFAVVIGGTSEQAKKLGKTVEAQLNLPN